MTKRFEETYPRYPFSRLVKFGLLLASYIVSLARGSRPGSSRAAGRAAPGASGTEQGELNG